MSGEEREDNIMPKPQTVTTVLKTDKTCKSVIRFRSPNQEDKVTTSLYLGKESWQKIGSPEEITVTVGAKQ